jgi:phosphoribosylanthranilate isomerase
MRIKICGITKVEQGCAIASLGATALGFICVPASPRYISPQKIGSIVDRLPQEIDKIGVFANATLEEITSVVNIANFTGIQLHGEESPEFCLALARLFPNLELIKALRVKSPETLATTKLYDRCVDTLLLDAYHPQMLGGTGKTLDRSILQNFKPDLPWLLAGGLTPDNVIDALIDLQPAGIDLSSGVEKAAGDKDLGKVAELFDRLFHANLREIFVKTADTTKESGSFQ